MSWTEYLRFRDGFIQVIDRNRYNSEWLDAQVWTGDFVLFTSGDSAILCSIKTYPTGFKELHGQAAIGNLRTIVSDLIPQAITFGIESGCNEAVISSRKGWERMMKDFEVYQIELRKVL